MSAEYFVPVTRAANFPGQLIMEPYFVFHFSVILRLGEEELFKGNVNFYSTRERENYWEIRNFND